MNIQRFIAPTSREAMSKARRQFGDSAVILSTRQTADGFEVMAAAEESLAGIASAAQPAAAPAASAAKAAVAQSSVGSDTEAMAMSTLSFQEYVRERMLRKRREHLGTGTAADETPLAAAPAKAADPIVVPVQRFNQPEPRHPQPIRTRNDGEGAWADSQPAARFATQGDNRMAVEISALKDMIEERFNTLAWLGSSKQNPIQSSLMHKLIRAGYSPAMSRALLEHLPAQAGAGDSMRWLMDVITRNLKVGAHGAGLVDEGGVVALVGATGVGKTTTAAKLAAQCVKQYGAGSVGLITLDTYRVGAHEQLRSYGRMLGIVAHLAHDRAALQDLLGLLSGKKMVLIDTTGVAPRDPRKRDMLDVLDLPHVNRLLVLNAGCHGDTLDDVLTAFKTEGSQQAILSKVDEAVKLGPAIDALIRHQMVLRGVTNGQRVPEDWERADAHKLISTSMRAPAKSAFDPKATDLNFFFSHSPDTMNERGLVDA